ncbi:MAG: hypothetical protein OEW18_08675 [Candidatus Aminicenantes bacterium]|nr:hypothetical protein [Candidatus Aminicenantes bacterium]
MELKHVALVCRSEENADLFYRDLTFPSRSNRNVSVLLSRLFRRTRFFRQQHAGHDAYYPRFLLPSLLAA